MLIEVNYLFFHVNKTRDLELISFILKIDFFVKKAFSFERSRNVCSVRMTCNVPEALMILEIIA